MLPTPQKMPGYPSCISLSIEFNPQAVDYQTVEQWITEREGYAPIQWVSEHEREEAIATDTMWLCQWYPVTPVGSCELAASTYEALMAAVNQLDEAK